ncbi:tail fiber domain-containing protein [Roseburia rectibacter]|uniref:tail fiber domain-containing protein n=1 Tax=Roseburia rectibacter TaxID=2763062 RepID=UPI00164B2627|nr:tail fiber domain-containing protein [Roseburia rectibacter]UMZ01244.1 tail fiber domain-containing protein [Roseburia rectibacter]
MELSTHLLKSFAKVVNQPSKETSKTSTIYGDLKNDKNDFYVKIDGSEEYIPTYTVVNGQTGDRVVCEIRNHSVLVTGNLSSPSATGDDVKQVSDKVDFLEANRITTDYLEAHYAEIDFANINVANIKQGFMESLLVSQGIIANRVVGSEVIATNVLTGVNIYADDIVAGTLSVDRLVFRGSEQSVIYQLNNISGALQAENVDTINGEVITPRTIAADRIIAKSITATEINVQNLVATGLIEANRLTSKNIVVDDLFATDITAAGSIKSSNYVYTSGIYSTAGVKMSMATGQIISRQFAIDVSGNTYFAGQLSAPTGNIGGFTIGTNSLYSGPDNLGSNKKGVYIGTDGISSIGDNGGKYVQIRNGKIIGHNSGSMPGTSEAVIDLTTASSAGNRAFGLGAQAGLLSVYMIDETAVNLPSAKGIIISYDGIYTGKYQSGTCVQNKTLLSVDGDVGCPLNLSNALWLRTYNTAGTLTRLIGMNSKDNVHMGDYNGDNISPVYIHARGKQYNFTDEAFCPNVTNDVTLGGASKLWKTVYAKTGTINTSDRTKKHDIKDLTEVYEKLFLKLQPKSFIFNDGDRVHIGAISQDVEDAMHELGMSAEDFAGFCKDIQYDYREYNDDGTPVEESRYIITDADGNPVYDYALRYQDFIFLTIHMVQKLFIKIEKIENEMDAMKMKIAL